MSLRRPEGNGRSTLREIHAVSRFEGTPDHLMVELTEGGYVAHGSSQQMEVEKARRTLLSVLPTSDQEAIAPDQLLKATGISRSTAQRAIELLEQQGLLKRMGKKG